MAAPEILLTEEQRLEFTQIVFPWNDTERLLYLYAPAQNRNNNYLYKISPHNK
ncbi:MAG TPA: hypothetical protein GX497_13925 [Bacillus bacterium]|nr:hypothetical protein [Bacillus sp. (in: firmicutes)]